ncbi:MAG: NAD(P)-binding domain-containing protein, partial [Gemmatimonadota bacterium]
MRSRRMRAAPRHGADREMGAKEAIGFVGIGIMGRAMAANLLRADFP